MFANDAAAHFKQAATADLQPHRIRELTDTVAENPFGAPLMMRGGAAGWDVEGSEMYFQPKQVA